MFEKLVRYVIWMKGEEISNDLIVDRLLLLTKDGNEAMKVIHTVVRTLRTA